MRSIFSLFVTSLVATAINCQEIGYRYLGRINTPNPAFLKVEKLPNQAEFLLISEFAAFSNGKVSVIPNIAAAIESKDFTKLQTVTLFDQFKWPNDIAMVPKDVFGEDAIVVPDGFLPPGHSNGEIFVITVNPNDITQRQQVYQISTSKSGFFYHTGFWVDINGDGRKDFLTARSNAKAGDGELVWYEHPTNGLQQLPWNEHVITRGPDVMIDLQDVRGYEGSLVVFAAEFFNKKLTVYQIAKGGQLIQSRVIDDTLDQAYSVRYVDIDNDGKKELLVNNHETDNSKAAIFLYDVPADLFKGTFNKRVIANGFKNAFSLLIPNMCPGFPYIVYPKTGSKAHILVAGDGDQSAHLMRPDGQGNFKREVIKNLGGTVGSLTTYDFGNDGYVEFLVPNYDKGYIEVYQFYDGPNYVGPVSEEEEVPNEGPVTFLE